MYSIIIQKWYDKTIANTIFRCLVSCDESLPAPDQREGRRGGRKGGILRSFLKVESVSSVGNEQERFQKYADATFKKDRRINIRISSKDLIAIQKRALEEGIPYQTLISSLLHKYVSGRLVEKESLTN